MSKGNPCSPKESRPEHTLPSGATGSMATAKAISHRPAVKTPKR
jgi:hypothetical protein